MQTIRQKTRQVLRAHAMSVSILTTIGIVVALVMWRQGGFRHANPGASWGSDIAILIGLVGLAFSTACLVITDSYHHLLPHLIVVPAAAFTLVMMILTWLTGGAGSAVLWGVVMGLAVGGALFVLALIPGAGLGGGDVKLAALLATVVGWLNPSALFLALLSALVAAALYAIVLIALHKGTLKTSIPLGPFLIVGAWAALGLGTLS